MIKNRNFLQSFQCAFRGIGIALSSQRNVRFHLSAAVAIIIVGFLARLTRMEFILLVVVIAIVMVAELVNSAMETSVDLVTREYHPLAKDAKDVAAGAVLFGAVMSIAVGCMLFIPEGRLFLIFSRLFSCWWSTALTISYVVLALVFIFCRKN